MPFPAAVPVAPPGLPLPASLLRRAEAGPVDLRWRQA